ncbi:hypothetical protein FB451DRAFT_1552467 [Mycena latifolia]|nr:hypothetical protein FB451DRAFT_1552467 [Mycena latifolia]
MGIYEESAPRPRRLLILTAPHPLLASDARAFLAAPGVQRPPWLAHMWKQQLPSPKKLAALVEWQHPERAESDGDRDIPRPCIVCMTAHQSAFRQASPCLGDSSVPASGTAARTGFALRWGAECTAATAPISRGVVGGGRGPAPSAPDAKSACAGFPYASPFSLGVVRASVGAAIHYPCMVVRYVLAAGRHGRAIRRSTQSPECLERVYAARASTPRLGGRRVARFRLTAQKRPGLLMVSEVLGTRSPKSKPWFARRFGVGGIGLRAQVAASRYPRDAGFIASSCTRSACATSTRASISRPPPPA